MADNHTKEIRSYNMRMIKGKDTKPELKVRRFLHQKGFRYILHDKRLPGKPDMVFKRFNTIININGCFWHGHNNCKYYVIPKTRTEWWLNKISRNKKNDKRNLIKLKKMGWNVIVIWECELKKNEEEKLQNVALKLKSRKL